MIHVSSPPPKQGSLTKASSQGVDSGQPRLATWGRGGLRHRAASSTFRSQLLHLPVQASISLTAGGEGVSKATLPEIDCLEDQRAHAEGLRPAHLYPGFSYSLLVPAMVPGQPLSHLLQRGPLVLPLVPLDNFTSCLQTPIRVLREVSSESSLLLPEVGGGRMCTSGHGSGPRSPKSSNADWDAKVFY